VRKDRFMPARQDGTSVPARLSMAVEVDTCVNRIKDADGNKVDKLRLMALPSQTLEPAKDPGAPIESEVKEPTEVAKVGGAVKAPVPIYTPDAIYTKDARKRKVQGECLVRLIVDAQGLPQNPQIVKSIDPGLDEMALQAVRRYRFNPGIKKGVGSVPVVIVVAVNFKLY